MEFGNPIVGLEELIRSAIRSKNYVNGSAGWRIAADGSAEFSTVILRGTGVGIVVVVGPAGNPQVRMGTASTFGYIDFPTNGPVENFVARVLSARHNIGQVNEYATLEIDGPSVDGVGATDRVFQQLSSQNNDGTSNANWNLQTSLNGSLLICDKDKFTVIPELSAPNYPSGGWTPFTPVWTTSSGNNSPSFGNAALNCDWTRAGRAITVRYDMPFGSSTNLGAAPGTADNWRFSVPVPASTITQMAGWAEVSYNGTTAARTVCRARLTTTTTMELEVSSGAVNAAVPLNTGIVDALTPNTWTTAGQIRAMITYDAAS
jgi:hypothetical protein